MRTGTRISEWREEKDKILIRQKTKDERRRKTQRKKKGRKRSRNKDERKKTKDTVKVVNFDLSNEQNPALGLAKRRKRRN